MDKMELFMRLAVFAAISSRCLSLEAGLSVPTEILVDFSREIGKIKPMHAVNNGPAVRHVEVNDQKRGNFEEYMAARIPYARTHDSVSCVPGGAHTCDINAIFPDFDADETDPTNYDFVFTDHYLDNIRRVGTEVFFRLGQSIEHGPRKYGVMPPGDYAKWARICEHVIRHYNEGWGWETDTDRTTKNIVWSNQFNIAYWEIWNEPDLDSSDDEPPRNPRCWGGTVTNFFRFYEVAAKHLKATFPHLKIGGPASCGKQEWSERFLAYCHDNAVPLDFHSFHIYDTAPRWIAAKCLMVRKLMDRHGFVNSELILDEWNYVKDMGDNWVYTLEVESGRFNQKAAAFIAATMVDCQFVPVDMLMFYDARTTSAMNSLFDRTTLWPTKGYYPFYAWSKMVDRGTQVASSLRREDGKPVAAPGTNADGGNFYAVAAKGPDGSGAVLIVRYSMDDNDTSIVRATLRVLGVSLCRARCCLTDAVRTYTEVPLRLHSDGSVVIRMQPNSFALVEF